MLVHNNIEQVIRIIHKLRAEDVSFVVHIDSKFDGNYEALESIHSVYLASSRTNCKWGDFSIVEAVVELCKTAENKCPSDYYVLLSGADYPVKSGEYIKDFLTGAGENYIEGYLLPTNELPWIQGGYRRVNAYNLLLKGKKTATIEPRVCDIHNLKQFIKVLLYKPSMIKQALGLFLSQRRQLPFEGRLFGGEMWWILNGETIRRILNYIDTHPEYIEYHKDTQIPDELFFNTLVYNLSADVKNETMRYIHWESRANLSPKFLTLNDKGLVDEIIKHPNFLFARKIEEEKLCDYIDKVVK